MKQSDHPGSLTPIQEKVLLLTQFLTENFETRHEALTALMHVTAAALEQEVQGMPRPLDEQYVAGYLVKITEMLDGVFDRPTGSRKRSGN